MAWDTKLKPRPSLPANDTANDIGEHDDPAAVQSREPRRRSVPDIGAVVERWDESPDLAKFGVGYLVYGLLDYVADDQFEAVQSLDDCMEELEDRLLEEVP